MTRTYWRRAHQVHLPDRMSEQVISKPHAEMLKAYENDKLNWEIGEQIAKALELDFDAARNRVEAR